MTKASEQVDLSVVEVCPHGVSQPAGPDLTSHSPTAVQVSGFHENLESSVPG
jgi:hypothetical protein